MKHINHNSISIQAMIDIYQKLINNGSIKEGDAGHKRMNELMKKRRSERINERRND